MARNEDPCPWPSFETQPSAAPQDEDKGLTRGLLHVRENELVGRWQVEPRFQPEHRGDARDNFCRGRGGVPAGGRETVRLRRRLRLVEQDGDEVAWLVCRQ